MSDKVMAFLDTVCRETAEWKAARQRGEGEKERVSQTRGQCGESRPEGAWCVSRNKTSPMCLKINPRSEMLQWKGFVNQVIGTR